VAVLGEQHPEDLAALLAQVRGVADPWFCTSAVIAQFYRLGCE
jgi:hypothetical protein